MRPNKIKQLWQDGKPATMGWLSIAHTFTAEIMARQGFDALCIDLQHGTLEADAVLPMLQAVSQTDTVPFVRVAWNDPDRIMRALDRLQATVLQTRQRPELSQAATRQALLALAVESARRGQRSRR